MLKVKVVLFSVLVSSLYFAQSSDDQKKYKPSFGFNLGMNQSLFFNSNDTESLEILNAPGFRLGILADFPLKKGWSISPKSELSFDRGSVIEKNLKYRVDPIVLNFALHSKYKYKNYTGKYRPYITFGPSLRVPVRDENQLNQFNTIPALGFDFSFGVDIDANHFLISPELRFTAGLTDIRRNPVGQTLRGSSATLLINFMSKRP